MIKKILLFAFVLVSASSAYAQKKPNVVIMLADNVGYRDIGAYGAGVRPWVIGPYLKIVGEYMKTLEKYPNPKAVNMTDFGRPTP